jgi:hypothetical protein
MASLSSPGRLSCCAHRALAALCLALLVTGSATAAPVIRLSINMSKQNGAHIAEVGAGSRVLLRLRGPDGGEVERRADGIASDLGEALVAGLRPAEVGANAEGQVTARGAVVATADADTAKAANTSPQALAGQWARGIRELAGGAYVAVTPAGSLSLPWREQRFVRWGGTAPADVSVTSQPPTVQLELQQAAHRIVLTGADVGNGVLQLQVAGQPLAMPVVCRKWAAQIRPASAALITGSSTHPSLVRQALLNAALAAATPEPGAVVELADVEERPDGLSATVEAHGDGYFATRRQVSVRTQTADCPRADATRLVVSNYPERVVTPGRLLLHAITPGEPARLLWHHVNDGTIPLRLTLRLSNTGGEPGMAHVSLAGAGPLADEIGAGHRAMVRFLSDELTDSGIMLRLPPGRSWDIASTVFRPRQVVSGLAQVTLLQGTQMVLEVVAETAGAVPEPTLASSPLSPAKIGALQTKYEFAAHKPLTLSHTIGGAWTFLPIGRDVRKNDHGAELAGEYGVLYDVTLTVRNEKDYPGQYEITLRGGGGAARTTLIMDGKLTETGLLTGGIETTLQRGTVPPRGEKVLRIRVIPESGSYYPQTLTVRSARD